MRKRLIKIIPEKLKRKAPTLKQNNILKALDKFEIKDKEEVNCLFDMLKADLTVINDFKEFYKKEDIPENFKVTGPLFSPSTLGEMDDNILKIFSTKNKKLKIFVTLGSSGKKEYLEEVLKALHSERENLWSAVVLAPSSVCSIDEVKKYASHNIYITDKFVKASVVNSMADIVICHGGQ